MPSACGAIDPLAVLVRSQLCRALYLTKRHDEAIAASQALIQMDATHSAAHQYLGLSLGELGRDGGAIAPLEQAVTLGPKNSERLAALAYGYALARRPADARTLMKQLQAPSVGFGNAYHVATIAAGLSDTDAALAWLEQAFRDREPMLANRVKIDPKLDPVRRAPRFVGLLRQMQLDR